MKIIKSFLDNNNSMPIHGKTISDRVVSQRKKHLWENRKRSIIDTVVIHYISAVEIMPDDPYCHEEILNIFLTYGVSSHYLIDRKGTVYHLVPEEKKAWHCGGSIMPEPDNRQGVNEFSIGIELIATDKSDFSDIQLESLSFLCREIESRHTISTFIGHEHVAGERAVALGLRKDKKADPGFLFDWDYFYSLKDRIV